MIYWMFKKPVANRRHVLCNATSSLRPCECCTIATLTLEKRIHWAFEQQICGNPYIIARVINHVICFKFASLQFTVMTAKCHEQSHKPCCILSSR